MKSVRFSFQAFKANNSLKSSIGSGSPASFRHLYPQYGAGRDLAVNYALNPHDAQVSFAVRNVNLRNQHGLGVDVVLNAGSLDQPSQDVFKKRFANGDPQGCWEDFYTYLYPEFLIRPSIICSIDKQLQKSLPGQQSAQALLFLTQANCPRGP
jgi:hypothetical protein